ncbi:hypothetical protein DPEC_G00241650 [Dallia pectoralis]|uniref:Uncharacterized protein n=1 Tax=Dallia pectoralis TaxID=75939 RepID=A0ACC2FV05_DALPE|nr:hypothetical protein DPEC_G00241650 [Dallia pectoralis]
MACHRAVMEDWRPGAQAFRSQGGQATSNQPDRYLVQHLSEVGRGGLGGHHCPIHLPLHPKEQRPSLSARQRPGCIELPLPGNTPHHMWPSWVSGLSTGEGERSAENCRGNSPLQASILRAYYHQHSITDLQRLLRLTSSMLDDLRRPHQRCLTHCDLIKAGHPAEQPGVAQNQRLSRGGAGPALRNKPLGPGPGEKGGPGVSVGLRGPGRARRKDQVAVSFSSLILKHCLDSSGGGR